MKVLSRRKLLRGTGGIALGLPVLEAMLPRTSHAQDELLNPRRIIFEFKPNGDQPSRRMTNSDERDFEFDEFLEPLTPYRDELLVLDRLDKRHQILPTRERADNHQQGGSSLAPWASGSGDFPVGGENRTVGYVLGPSIDYEIGNRIVERYPIPYRHLVYRVGDRGNNIWNLHSHAGPVGEKNPVLPETSPYSAYARLFTVGGTEEDAELAERRVRMSESLLDLVLEDNQALERQLAGTDREKLEQYTDSLRDIERTLVNDLSAPACDPMPFDDEVDVYDDTMHAEVGHAFYKLMTMALACDLTRTVNFNWHGNTSNRVYRNLGLDEGHHDISHRSDETAFSQVRMIHRHLWGLTTALYEDLKSVSEGDQTLWDNTLVVHWNELGQGDLHSTNDSLVVFAGGSAGYFDRGRYVNFRNQASFSDMLVSCLHYMGFEDVEDFGDPRLATGGPLSGITA